MNAEDAVGPTGEELRQWMALAEGCAARLLRGSPIDGVYEPEDFAGIAMLRLIEHFQLLADMTPSARNCYIGVTVRHAVADELRKARGRRRKVVLVSLEDLGHELEDGAVGRGEDAAVWIEAETADAVRALVGQLPPRQREAVLASLACPGESQAECVAWLQERDAAGDWTESTYRNSAHKGRKTLQAWAAAGLITREQFLQILAFCGGAALAAGGTPVQAADSPGREPEEPAPAGASVPLPTPALPEPPGPTSEEPPSDDNSAEETGPGLVGLVVSALAVGLGVLALVRALVPLPIPRGGSPAEQIRTRLRRTWRDLLGAFLSVLALAGFFLVHALLGVAWAAACFAPVVAAGPVLYAWRYGKASRCVVFLVATLCLVPAACAALLAGLQWWMVRVDGEALGGVAGRVYAGLYLDAVVFLALLPALGLVLTPPRRLARLRSAWRQGRYLSWLATAAWCLLASYANFFRGRAGLPERERRRQRALCLVALALALAALFALARPAGKAPWLDWILFVPTAGLAVLLFVCLREAGRNLRQLERLLVGRTELPAEAAARIEVLLRNRHLDNLLDALGRSWFVGDEADKNPPPRHLEVEGSSPPQKAPCR